MRLLLNYTDIIIIQTISYKKRPEASRNLSGSFIPENGQHNFNLIRFGCLLTRQWWRQFKTSESPITTGKGLFECRINGEGLLFADPKLSLVVKITPIAFSKSFHLTLEDL